jgi:hypothetical protein
MSSVRLRGSILGSITIGEIAALAAMMAASPTSIATASLPVQGESGSIRGRLIWGGAELPKLESRTVDREQSVCGKTPITLKYLLVDPRTKGIGNAFAYLLDPTTSNSDALQALLAHAPEVVIDQKSCEFVPFSTALHQDQTLIFKSSDPVNHNVRFTALRNNAVNQILPPHTELRVKLIAEKYPLPLGCNLHVWMKGTIMVFDHPFFGVTNDDGSFEIQGVPVGEQKLVLRLASGKYVIPNGDHAILVQVQKGRTSEVEVRLDR